MSEISHNFWSRPVRYCFLHFSIWEILCNYCFYDRTFTFWDMGHALFWTQDFSWKMKNLYYILFLQVRYIVFYIFWYVKFVVTIVFATEPYFLRYGPHPFLGLFYINRPAHDKWIHFFAMWSHFWLDGLQMSTESQHSAGAALFRVASDNDNDNGSHMPAYLTYLKHKP